MAKRKGKSGSGADRYIITQVNLDKRKLLLQPQNMLNNILQVKEEEKIK